MRTSMKAMALSILATTVLGLAGCKSAKKSEDLGSGGGPDGSSIESTPMSFDPSGSDSGNIAGLQTINFPYDSSTLSADAKAKAKGNAEWMKSNPNTTVQIEGHCDSRGSIEYNLALGERRANAVKAYMAGLGIASNRLSVISYGKEKPLATGDSEADHARNRRANFLPLGQ